MPLKLRPYQKQALDLITKKKGVIVPFPRVMVPTGAGKSGLVQRCKRKN